MKGVQKGEKEGGKRRKKGRREGGCSVRSRGWKQQGKKKRRQESPSWLRPCFFVDASEGGDPWYDLCKGPLLDPRHTSYPLFFLLSALPFLIP